MVKGGLPTAGKAGEAAPAFPFTFRLVSVSSVWGGRTVESEPFFSNSCSPCDNCNQAACLGTFWRMKTMYILHSLFKKIPTVSTLCLGFKPHFCELLWLPSTYPSHTMLKPLSYDDPHCIGPESTSLAHNTRTFDLLMVIVLRCMWGKEKLHLRTMEYQNFFLFPNIQGKSQHPQFSFLKSLLRYPSSLPPSYTLVCGIGLGEGWWLPSVTSLCWETELR